MILRLPHLAVIGLFVLTACASTPEPVRYATTAHSPGARIAIPHQTIALREVSLPAYATDEGISIADQSGAIREAPGSIWADDPTRAVTLRLTNALADVTGRTVAADPWPFDSTPEVVVEVRMEEFVAEEAGRYVAQGRFYVAHAEDDRSDDESADSKRADRAGSFNIIQPFDPELGFPAIADARSRVIAALARQIAQRGLR
ncbi:MAG: hypothetical protein HKN27_12885 [Silicimonas sp.]|nr:hypothetical protein [Silicimonas sp.]